MIPGELSKKRVFHFTTALVSLVPRQIMLGTKNEEKVQKGLSQTLDANNGAKKGGGGEGDERLLLLRSIAAFLESNGFSRSLKRFRSEAEIDTGKGQSLDLEHVFHEYIKKRGHPAEADVDCLKMQGSDNFKSPPVPNTSDSQPAETVTSKDKKEKKKKCKSVSENSELESAPQAVNAGKKEDSVDHETNGYLNKSDPGKENRSILNKGVDKHLDKTSKKRKRLGIEESKSQFENETLTKKSKKRKSKDSENNVETGLYTERSQVEEGHLGHDKKRKVDKFQEDLNKSLKVPLDDQTVGQIGDKEHQIFERNNVNNTTDKREPVKLGKNEGKHSAEVCRSFQVCLIC
ncbi:hypothetical protein QJS04_geneDACA014809 [Acorus gramineus]|uniref:LisH domain-containing protein n=1 Tax=Acorus gramineus TaxID=55184 RepID=A0AAV9BN27_ACOGR|nr:hypothetical protein QJS04_geneDACA014809 [Acorus gramineus]